MVVSLGNQSAVVTVKQGESLHLDKLVEAVEDSELGVKGVNIVIKGRVVKQDGRLAIKENINGTLFLISEGSKLDEAMMGAEIRLAGKVHALRKNNTLPHLIVESFELLGTK